MAKGTSGYRCTECGWETVGYVGRCGECQQWNTLRAFTRARARVATAGGRNAAAPAPEPMSLAGGQEFMEERMSTGIPEFDRVLGDGVVPGAVILVGGDPGIGKSTLVLQAAAFLARDGARVAYICGEESPGQVRRRADRLGVRDATVQLVSETAIDTALVSVQEAGARVLIVDSIQAVYVEGVDARAGGPAQLAEAGARLVQWAKRTDTAVIVTGHVTKDGDIAGPRLLEHLVDTVLYFEGAEGGALRILRAVKNRFGATDEVGVFEMTGVGLRSVDNPASAFLDAAASGASGCAPTAVIEGSRPLVVEVQALAVPSNLASPRRIASGIETARLHLLLAVLARRAGIASASFDVIATVAGGLRVREPGIDLAVIAALVSALKDEPLPARTAFLGEVALSGGVRPVQQAERRIVELGRLGFERVFAPPGTAGAGVRVSSVASVRQLVDELAGG